MDQPKKLLNLINMELEWVRGAARFSRYLGILARDSNQMPFSYLLWDKVPREKKILLWQMIRVSFCIPQILFLVICCDVLKHE
ncbi:uncharacterized protein M6B38_322835 [Iris pallida]|uniref:Uncharacterized protein n=1 Tax=Iris pallida TaxID=29817 RepID=A0AAX6H9N9_IRIPA|nr:uncharacterized protein M6B38_322835 [Iris pallida]